MNEQQALSRMISPAQIRPNKPNLGGVIQIHLTRACNMACFNCTQGSNLAGKVEFMPLRLVEQAVLSLRDYFGVVGIFGGNPALHPEFPEVCRIVRNYIPLEKRGLWCNHPKGHGKVMAQTFNPTVSNLNVHTDREAYEEFKRDWPRSMPFGLTGDSRHSPTHVAMKDVIPSEEQRWSLIADCDINQRWSAMIAMFRGELRAWFCEIAGAQSILHQYESDYPDTGLDPTKMYDRTFPNCTGRIIPSNIVQWWQLPMTHFAEQVRKHCHECGVPLRGYGELSQESDESGVEQCSSTHQSVYHTKRPKRRVEVVTGLEQLGTGRLQRFTDYIQNGKQK